MINIQLNKINKKCGIYIIVNQQNNKIYIGSSSHIYYRLRRHLSDFRKNRHSNPLFQNSFNKNGENYFHSCIIEECNENNLTNREQYWIDLLKPEYNLRHAERFTLSESSKVLISETLKRKYASGEIQVYRHPDKMKKVGMYLDNILIKEFESCASAGRYIGLTRGHMAVKLNPNNRCKNYYKWNEFIFKLTHGQ